MTSVAEPHSRLRVWLLLYDMQEFGGLEEYVVTLASGLRGLGHDVSVLSFAWVADDNQYLRRLGEQGIGVVQVPGWLAHLGSDWDTKIRVLGGIMRFLSPIIYALAVAHAVRTRRPWERSLQSACGWVSGRIMRFLAPDWRPWTGPLLMAWYRVRHRPDVVHIHGYTTNLLFAVEWAHSKRVPIVYEEHQTPDAQFDWWRDFSRVVNKSRTVVAVSRQSAEALRQVCGVTQPIVVRPPLLPDPLGAKAATTTRSRADARALVVTAVARLYVTKGLKYLLDAAVQLRATHPTVQFRVYGDGPLRAELWGYAAQLGLDPATIFRGVFTSRNELASILPEADVFVMSSILEGQPLGLVEAMAYGCPIVATTVGGIPELIQDGVNGRLCPPADPLSLADAIRSMLDDGDGRRRMGREARLSYERGGFQPPEVCSLLAATYARALDTARPHGH